MSDFDAIDSLLDAVDPQAELPPCQVRRELRERARLSKAQVARALGVSPSTLSGWESGRDPAGEVRTKYAYLLDGLNTKLATETETTVPPAAEQPLTSDTAATATLSSSPDPGPDDVADYLKVSSPLRLACALLDSGSGTLRSVVASVVASSCR